MKKVLIALLAASMLLSAGACQATTETNSPTPEVSAIEDSAIPGTNAQTNQSDNATYVSVIGTDGEQVKVMQNPKRVAIYDYAILDMLQSIGFEKTGIEVLVVPAKENLPDALAFYKEQSKESVVSGGTLFYVDRDVLDLVQPEVVILGARSFGMNAAGERLSSEENEQYKTETIGRLEQAGFVTLAANTKNAQLLTDMETNVTALKLIFPEIADELDQKLATIKTDLSAIHDKVEASGSTALFAMMVDPTTLSVFNPNSRFDMLYEEFGFTPVDSDATEWDDSHGFDVRAEYILEKNPDVIFILDRSATVGAGAGADNFIKDPIITQTKAAETGNIYVLTGDAWYTITGGFQAVETMIDDIKQYTDKLEQ